jgi:ribonuclease P protein component
MLPKARKLRDKQIFTGIFKGGKRIFGRYHTTYTLATSGQSRFACVVSLKVSKKAVLRNKIRRWGFAAIAGMLSQVKDGYVVVLVFKTEAVAADFNKIHTDIAEVFKKAQLLD